jgi:hypothetical protein
MAPGSTPLAPRAGALRLSLRAPRATSRGGGVCRLSRERLADRIRFASRPTHVLRRARPARADADHRQARVGGRRRATRALEASPFGMPKTSTPAPRSAWGDEARDRIRGAGAPRLPQTDRRRAGFPARRPRAEAGDGRPPALLRDSSNCGLFLACRVWRPPPVSRSFAQRLASIWIAPGAAHPATGRRKHAKREEGRRSAGAPNAASRRPVPT